MEPQKTDQSADTASEFDHYDIGLEHGNADLDTDKAGVGGLKPPFLGISAADFNACFCMKSYRCR